LGGDVIVVDYEGSIVYARVNKDGLYVCPVCEVALFQSPRDLMLHIMAHAKGYTEKLAKIKEVE
jgi:hypothetical protein